MNDYDETAKEMAQKMAEYVIRLDEANGVIQAIQDVRVRYFAQYGLVLLLTRRRMSPNILPQSPIDLCYFAEAMKALGEHRDALLEILQGDPTRLDCTSDWKP
jgi:hypothetical protein